MNLSKRSFYISVSIITILDLLTKYIITTIRPEISAILGFINITFVKNYGISFGIFNSASAQIFQQIALSIIVICIIFYIIKHCSMSIGTSFIIGGACGNLLNRIYSGYVIDFIDLFINVYHWPAFNIADSFICVGGIIFLLEEHNKFSKSSKNYSNHS